MSNKKKQKTAPVKKSSPAPFIILTVIAVALATVITVLAVTSSNPKKPVDQMTCEELSADIAEYLQDKYGIKFDVPANDAIINDPTRPYIGVYYAGSESLSGLCQVVTSKSVIEQYGEEKAHYYTARFVDDAYALVATDSIQAYFGGLLPKDSFGTYRIIANIPQFLPSNVTGKTGFDEVVMNYSEFLDGMEVFVLTDQDVSEEDAQKFVDKLETLGFYLRVKISKYDAEKQPGVTLEIVGTDYKKTLYVYNIGATEPEDPAEGK